MAREQAVQRGQEVREDTRAHVGGAAFRSGPPAQSATPSTLVQGRLPYNHQPAHAASSTNTTLHSNPNPNRLWPNGCKRKGLPLIRIRSPPGDVFFCGVTVSCTCCVRSGARCSDVVARSIVARSRSSSVPPALPRSTSKVY